MIDTGYLYIVPLVVGIVVLTLKLLLSQNIGRKRVLNSEWGNLFYNLSAVAPFKWFIESDDRDIKVLKTNHLIKEAGMTNVMNYQSMTAMQLSLLFGGVIAFGMINIMIEPLVGIFSFLLNLDSESILSNAGALNLVRIFTAIIFITPGLFIKPYLKRKAKKNELAFIKDLPLLQLFISLMLRSDRTINEVLYVLSTTKSTYKSTFQRAYLIYLREPDECFDYLEETFDGTKILETVYTLRDYSEYEKEESIRTLENNQDEIEEFTKLAKKKMEAGNNVMATISMGFPFIAILLLAAGPIAYWGLEMIVTTL